MGKQRSYHDGCAAAHALDIVGERWALLVVRELLLGPKRFTDLRKSLPGISPNVLSQRLQDLEEAGVAQRRILPPPYGMAVYELTEWGAELEPVIVTIGQWGAKSPTLPRENPLSVNSLVLSFRSMFDPQAAAGVTVKLQLFIDGEPHSAKISGRRVTIKRGLIEGAEATVAGEPGAIAALTYDGAELEFLESEGLLEVTGDRKALKSFLSCFHLPEPAKPEPVETLRLVS